MAQESFQRKYSSINSKFVNIHVGITPKYRGVHGTYWALVNNDVENSGVTVHL
jgi:methionyl-tRNA formyltransferase